MKNKYPKVKLSLSKSFEKDYFEMFSDNPKGMRPEMRFLFEDRFRRSRNKILSAYVDNFYKEYKETLESDLEFIKKEWSGLEDYFFKQVDKIFKNYPWPKGNYRGYGSIWCIFPRIIPEKIFTFPIDLKRYNTKRLVSIVIAHEMLHFIMYDYLEKKYKLKPSECFSKDNIFWQFTENFNILIENEKIWDKFTKGQRKDKGYPGCEKMYLKMKKVWDKNKDLDNLVEESLLKK